MAEENPWSRPVPALLLDTRTSGRRFAGIAWERAEACVAAWRTQGIAGRLLTW